MNYLLVLAIVVFLLLPGCVRQELPACERYQAMAATNANGEAFIILDMENVKKLAKLITGLADGTCRLAAPAPKGKATNL